MKCEACGEDTSGRRRKQCYHCGRFVCSWCWRHIHGCEPGHTRATCRNLAYLRRYGKPYLRRLRAVVLAEAAEKERLDTLTPADLEGMIQDG